MKKSEIKNSTSEKWLFSAMLLSVIDLVPRKVLAASIHVSSSLHREVQLGPSIEIIGFVLTIATIIDILYTKIRAKTKKEEFKISKGQKVFFIVSISLIILCNIIKMVKDYYYWMEY